MRENERVETSVPDKKSVSSRFLSYSSIISGWEHLKQALYQISKVNIFSGFFCLVILLILDNTKCVQLQEN
jgi:hypothetical protein